MESLPVNSCRISRLQVPDGSSLPYMKGKEYGQFLAQYYPSFSMEDYLHFLNRFELDAQERIASLSKGGKIVK